MPEYIEREYLVKEAEAVLNFRKRYYTDKARIADAQSTLEWLKYYAPAADVVERKRGEWIEGVVIQTDISTLYDYTCSECSIVTDRESNFCPNCGADMRGESE